jgi:hypothetical protein
VHVAWWAHVGQRNMAARLGAHEMGWHVAPGWALTDWDGSRARGAQLGAHKEGM